MKLDVADVSRRSLVRVWRAIKEALYPLNCLMCGQFFNERPHGCDDLKRGNSYQKTIQAPLSATLFGGLMAQFVCPACSQQFTPIQSPCCTCCGVMFKSREGEDHLCGECINSKRFFGMARAVGMYNQALMAVIHSFKYGQKVGLATPLSILLLNAYHRFWQGRYMDVVVPVPLFGRRQRERGFNQVYLAIRHWEYRQWQDVLPKPLRVERGALQRIRSTPPQTGLGRRDRMKNVKGAFVLDMPDNIRKKRILLVDDVFTTGATVNECARVLIKGGAEKVDVLTFARAM